MLDFRYHALSLVAVFIALAVGLVIGVAIGDRGLVSNARNDIAKHLLDDARAEAATLRAQLNVRRDFERETYGRLVADRLPGQRFALVFLGGSSDVIARRVDDALTGSGGSLRYVAVVRDAPDLAALAARAPATAYAGLAADPTLLRRFATATGRSLVRGGQLARAERQPLLSTLNGGLGPVDGVIVARIGAAPTGDAAAAVTDLQEGLVQGMVSTDAPVVGVETTTEQPSQVPWYQSLRISSVDDVDDVAGRAGLVFVLAGAKGAYGVKPLATDGLVPRLLGTAATP